MTGDLGREVESREIKQCLPDTRPEVPPGQCNARCCTQIRQKSCRPFSTQSQEKISSNDSYYFLFNISLFLYLWLYPRRGSVPKAKEQSKRGTLPERRAQSSPAQQSPASQGGRGACTETSLSQDTPHPAGTGLAVNLHLKPAFGFNPILWCAPARLLSHAGGMRGQEILCR